MLAWSLKPQQPSCHSSEHKESRRLQKNQYFGICIRKQTNKQNPNTNPQTYKPRNRILQQVYSEMLSSGDQDQVLCGVGWSAHSSCSQLLAVWPQTSLHQAVRSHRLSLCFGPHKEYEHAPNFSCFGVLCQLDITWNWWVWSNRGLMMWALFNTSGDISSFLPTCESWWAVTGCQSLNTNETIWLCV